MTTLNDGIPFTVTRSGGVGLSRRDVREALAVGALRRVFRGVLVDADVADTRELRSAAALLVVPRHAVACDDFAAWVHGADTRTPGDRFEMRPSFVVPHGRNRITPDRARTRQTVVPDRDVVELNGLLLTSPLRTAADLLRLRWRPYALAAADALAHARVVDEVALREYVAELRRFPGTKQAKELAPRVDRRAESHGESWQRCRILDAGFPRPELQLEMKDGDGVPRFFDMAYEELLIASEYDGREFHTADTDVEHDERRRAYFERRFGWRFNIGTSERIFGQDPSFEMELGEMLRREPRPRSW
ncbi:conserved hypothetical protein [Beutenbergia cavernae DSM 12333]|uniref:DUF559 domain-containing protein n=1 Tax=Beutenbergia cavernae (strain ATCC BAA-8 / DSM 12333 / CCUG 43141 / JCM 11478 / NBRC 16432 / NCIMB 13614 / HKI 0122) TaxID=471853 RepID=C5C485_BEUC1|nr:hypothetical protein [Beutenbergia cavernae]ACQ79998.1 conserved hypothetical protein [Beutenbergia cavernae DSM 12333]